MSQHQCASWMRQAVSRQECDEALRNAELRLDKVEFDTVAFTGVSGVLFGPVLAYKMHKEVACVRKQGQATHSDYGVEGFKEVKKYIIADDFISTGETVKSVIKKMRQFAPQAVCVGVYAYYRNKDAGKFSDGFIGPDNELFELLLSETIEIEEEVYENHSVY